MKPQISFNTEELVEILGAYLDTETGNDDFKYQNYLEFPRLETLDFDTIQLLINDLGIDIKFEEEIEFTEINNYINSFPEISLSLFKVRDEDGNKYSLDELILISPSYEEVHPFILDLLREAEIPEGTIYELEDDNFPEKRKLWYDPEQEYLMYQFYSIHLNHYKSNLDNIRTEIKDCNNDITKKALLFSAFVYTESLTKSLISNSLENYTNNIENEKIKNFFEKYISKQLERTDNRKKLTKEFLNISIDNIPYKDLRDLLAHDIGSPTISSNLITFNSKAGNSKLDINDIIDKLEEYSSNLYDNLNS